MKKIYSLIAISLCTILAVHAEVYDGMCGSTLSWSLNTETGLLSFSGSGDMSYTGNAPWYDYRTDITKVYLPEGVTSIKSYAFSGCLNLSAIVFPNTVSTINASALYNCSSLRKVTFGENLTSIGSSVLRGCTALDTIVWNAKNYSISSKDNTPFYYYTSGSTSNNWDIRSQIKSITFGPNVEAIPAYLCYNMNYINTPVVIPESVTSIGAQAFYNCNRVPTLTLNKSIQNYSNQFNECTGLNKVYYTGTIAEWCGITFSSSAANPVSYANNLYINNELATEITIPASVTAIGNYQFYNATCLNKITLPSTLSSIGADAFYACSNIEEVNLENTAITQVNGTTFYGCSSLTSIEFPNSVTTIKASALSNCSSLRKVTFGENLTSIGSSVLRGCTALDTIVWNAKNYSISDQVNTPFYYHVSSASSSYYWDIRSQIKSFTFGPNVETIPAYLCYSMSSLNTPIVIPESVTSIGTQAFYGCSSVQSLTLNKAIKSYNSEFSNCSGLTKVFYTGTIEDWCGITFSSATNHPLNYAHNLYINNELVTEITIPNTVTSIGDYQFYNATCLEKVTLPSTITTIGTSAFYSCSNLETINLENTAISKVNSSTFSDCSKLKAIEFPNSVTTINGSALYNCSSLRKVTFGENLTSIGSSVLRGCTALDTIVWNAKNYSISDQVNTPFYYHVSSASSSYYWDIRSQIKSFTFGSNVETIPAYLCSGMTGIIVTTVPASVTSIGTKAFYSCSSNKTVINHSNLDIAKGATTHGYIAYYASDVYTGNDTIGDFVFAKSDDKDYAVAYLGSDCQITLPANYRGNSYGIGSSLFRNNTITNSITISNAVTSIGDYAFSGCLNLNVVYIGNSVISIGEGAFYNCPELYKIIMLPNSVPSGITSSFQSLSGRITYVGNTNYQSGYNVLGTQRVYSNLNSYFTVDGIVYALVNPSKRTCDIIDCDYSGTTTEFSIGNSVVYKKVTLTVDSININAFRNNNKMTKMVINYDHALPSHMASYCSNLTRVEVNNLAGIGSNAFSNSSKNANAYYYINNNGDIASSAFENCTSIDTLIITTNVGKIGTSAFSGCSKNANAYYNINNSGDIATSAFANCDKLYKLVVADSVKNIGNKAFYKCANIANAEISNNGGIGNEAFRYSSTNEAATYHINNKGVLGNYTFANCTSMKDLVVDSCVSSIGQYTFQNCYGLEDVTLKNNGMIGLKAFEGSSTLNPATYIISNIGLIGESAFANCTSIKNLTIDTCVTTVSQSAFQKCYGLENVTLKNNGTIGVEAFEGSATKTPATYTINNVGMISESAFANCSKLQKIQLGNQVSKIDKSAFAQCVSLQKARLGNQIANIDQRAFYNCMLLDSITLPNTVTVLGDSVFYNCKALAYAQLSNTLTSIGGAAFARCNSLPEIFIPKSVNSIGHSTFRKCTSLSTVGFEDSSSSLSLGRDSIERGLFYDCPLDSVYIGRELTYQKTSAYGYSPFYRNSTLRSIVVSDFPSKVETNEFYGCTNLYYVFIGNGVQSIGDYAFSGCSSIDYFSFGSQVQTIGAEAFSDCVAMTRLYSYCQVPPTCGASALADIDKWSCTLYIPDGTIDAYSAADQWMDFFFVEENGGSVQYTITVNYDNTKGNVTGSGVYDRGAEAILVATPGEGYIFVEWEDGSTNPERHIYAYKSETYTATFSAPKYELYNGTDIAVSDESAPNNIEIDRVSYPNAIAYSYLTTTDINLPDNICGQNNEGDWYADSIALIDAQPFYAPYDVEAKHLSYARTFENDQWQALYVPFDMQYADFSSKVRIAYVNNVHQYDDDDNGVIDRTVIEFISVVNDDIKANWPYIVKPNTTGAMTFNVANTTLHATEENDVECQSAFTRFNVIGTYQNTPVINKYIVHDGEFELCESLQTVSPFRIYLVVTNKYPTSPQPAPMRITFMIDGREEPAPTDVEVLFENDSTGEFYDVLGRPVSRPSHGIFIRNGEKILVK